MIRFWGEAHLTDEKDAEKLIQKSSPGEQAVQWEASEADPSSGGQEARHSV